MLPVTGPQTGFQKQVKNTKKKKKKPLPADLSSATE